MTERTARSDGEPRDAVHRFSRWPGLLALSAGWLLPFVVVLLSQSIAYMALPWACARQQRLPLHIVPIVALLAIGWCGVTALLDWRRAGGGSEEERATVLSRSRFLSLLGIWSALFAALIQIVMWIPIFVFDPCMRS